MPHRETPLLYSKRISARLGVNAFLKLDLLQPSQSFKTRGIGHFCRQALKKAPSKELLHLVVASGGNAGLACSSEAAALGVRCSVFLPEGAAESTILALQSDGSHVTVAGKEFVHALKAAEALVATDPSAVLVPAYDNPDVWQGHASLVHELQRQLKEHLGHAVQPDSIFVSCGGGGLLGGIIIGTQELGWDKTKIVAVESQGADALFQTLEANKDLPPGSSDLKIVELAAVTSQISSLGARSPSPAVARMALERPITAVRITDDQARQAARQYADEEKMLPELACAATLTPAYLPQVLQDQWPTWGRTGWKLGQKWNVLPDPELPSVVFVACGGAKVSVDEASTWPRPDL